MEWIHEAAAASARAASVAADASAVAVPSSDWALDGLPLSQMLRRPVPTSLPELKLAARSVRRSSRMHDAEVQLWRDTPMGYMINTADVGQENNLAIKHIAFAHKTCEIPALYAARDIFPGEELLSRPDRPYGSTTILR